MPELDVPEGSVTIAFIRSKDVSYFEPQYDPLFRTVTNWTSSTNNTFFTRRFPVASALGCVETYELCLPESSGLNCLDLLYHEPASEVEEISTTTESFGINVDASIELAYGAYQYCNPSYSIIPRSGQILDAQSKMLIDGFSLSLPSNQWEIEAQKIFNVTLATFQLNVWRIARGERMGDGVPEQKAPLFHFCVHSGCIERICQSMKIQATGWKNINLSWFVALLTLSICLSVGSVEIDEKLILVWGALGIWKLAKLVFTRLVMPALRLVRHWAGRFFSELVVPKLTELANVRWRELPHNMLAMCRRAGLSTVHVLRRSKMRLGGTVGEIDGGNL